MKKLGFIFSWLPIGIAVTLLSFLVYGVVQQTIRLSANSPQIQLAEDAAVNIVRGASPQAVIPKDNVDMAASLSPYMIVYDDQGNILASSVELDGKVPVLPSGVLAQAREQEVRVTWQPRVGVRSAAVIVRFVGDKPGFVLAGRSLREVEKLEDVILRDVFMGWVVTMVVTLVAFFLFRR